MQRARDAESKRWRSRVQSKQASKQAGDGRAQSKRSLMGDKEQASDGGAEYRTSKQASRRWQSTEQAMVEQSRVSDGRAE